MSKNELQIITPLCPDYEHVKSRYGFTNIHLINLTMV